MRSINSTVCPETCTFQPVFEALQHTVYRNSILEMLKKGKKRVIKRQFDVIFVKY